MVPILPVDQLMSYMYHLPFKVPRSEHSHMAAILPQHFADQFGWVPEGRWYKTSGLSSCAAIPRGFFSQTKSQRGRNFRQQKGGFRRPFD